MDNNHYTKEQAEILDEFKKKAEKNGFEYFALLGNPTDGKGASVFGAVSDNQNSAARNARKAHIEWERKNGIDSNHDREKDVCFCGSGKELKKCHGA